MIWLLLLIVLLAAVLAWIYIKRNSTRIHTGAGEAKRDVLVYYNKDSDAKAVKQALGKLKGVTPHYNVLKPSEYCNVPVIWIGDTCSRVTDFQRAHPGVCGAIILWHPTQCDDRLGPDSAAYTFVVLDVSKRGHDKEWSDYSHHRYYIPKGAEHTHLGDILSLIR